WLGQGADDIDVTTARVDDVTTLYGNKGNDTVTFAATAVPKLFVVHGDEGMDTVDAGLVTNLGSTFVFIGDRGQEDYSGKVKSAASLRNVRSIDGTLGDNDILIGGRGDDALTSGVSDDVLIGDNGESVYVSGATVRNTSTLAASGTAGASYVLT